MKEDSGLFGLGYFPGHNSVEMRKGPSINTSSLITDKKNRWFGRHLWWIYCIFHLIFGLLLFWAITA
jgi:hypothetical protein